MSSQVQELIEKIKIEGVEAADQKAKEIEGHAKSDAQKVIDQAKLQATQIIADAKVQAQKIQASTEMALKQAARDTLLTLRREIEKTLGKIIAQQVGDTLSADHLAGIIEKVAQSSVETQLANDDIRIVLSVEDLNALKNGFIAKLQKAIKQHIKFEASDDIKKGFTISFDQGKSCFDFSDASLTEYLGTYLNTQTAALIQEAG